MDLPGAAQPAGGLASPLSRLSRLPRLPRLPDGLGEALWLFVVMRVGLSVFALVVLAHAASVPTSCHFELALDHWLTVPPLASSASEFPLIGVWQRWDACWYSKIATFGYEAAENSSVFWPALPAAMHLVAIPIGGDVALSGLLVAAVAYIVAIVGLYRLVKADWDEDLARRTSLFITIAPAALFLFAPFTEAPFLAATVWALYAARQRHWGIAAVAALVASLTRIQGVFLVLPLAWEAFRAWRDRDRDRDGRWRALGRPSLRSIAATLVPVVGFVGFLVVAKVWSGRTPLDTQDIWGGRNFHWPWDTVAATLQWIGDHHDSLEALNLAMLLLFTALVLAGIRRLPVSYSLIAIPQVALLAIRIQPTPLTSTVRYVEVVFPAFVVLAMFLKGRRREWTWGIASLLALGALTWMWVIGDWVA